MNEQNVNNGKKSAVI